MIQNEPYTNLAQEISNILYLVDENKNSNHNFSFKKNFISYIFVQIHMNRNLFETTMMPIFHVWKLLDK